MLCCALILGVSGFRAVSVPLVTDFHHGDVLDYGRRDTYISWMCSHYARVYLVSYFRYRGNAIYGEDLYTSGHCFFSDAQQASATYHRSSCEHCLKGGSEPLTSTPRSEFLTQSLILSINVWRDLGSSTRVMKFHANCAGLVPAKYVRIDVYVRSVTRRCTGRRCHTVGVRDALLFVLIRALYCASLQCVWCRTRRCADELKFGRLVLFCRITAIINVYTIFIL